MSSSKSSKNGTSNVPSVDFMARGVEAPLEKVKDSFCEAALKEEATERTGEIWKGGAATNGLSGESLGKPSIFLLGEGMMRAEFSIKENPWFAETSLRLDCCAKRDAEDLSCCTCGSLCCARTVEKENRRDRPAIPIEQNLFFSIDCFN